MSIEIASRGNSARTRVGRLGRVRILIFVLAGSLTVGGIYGGATSCTRDAAVASATSALGSYNNARAANTLAVSRLERDLKPAAIEYASLTPLLEATAYFKPERLKATTVTLSHLEDFLEENGATNSLGVYVPTVHRAATPSIVGEINPRQPVTELMEFQEQIIELSATVHQDTVRQKKRCTRLDDIVDEVKESLAELAASVPATAAALVAATPSADQPSRNALTEALDKVASGVNNLGTLTEPLLSYVNAAGAVLISHDVAEAQKAAETENRAPEEVAKDSYYDESQNYPNGSNDYGGGGGDSDGGDGDAFIPDTNRYIVTNANYVPYSSCPNGGGVYGGHDPGPGGTSRPSFGFPWSYTGGGNAGFTWYVC
jgi:hypothetical protein